MENHNNRRKKFGGGFKTIRKCIRVGPNGDVDLKAELRLRSGKRSEKSNREAFRKENQIGDDLPEEFLSGELLLRAEKTGNTDEAFNDYSLIMDDYKYDLTQISDILRDMGAIDDSQKEAIIIQAFSKLANAVKKLHRKGYVHRDIKPDNILCNIVTNPQTGKQELDLKIIDFGFTNKSQNREFVGTRAYYSPEQLANRPSNKAGPSDDIWALAKSVEKLANHSCSTEISKEFKSILRKMLKSIYNSYGA